jgi:hypothetical protein
MRTSHYPNFLSTGTRDFSERSAGKIISPTAQQLQHNSGYKQCYQSALATERRSLITETWNHAPLVAS